MGDPRQFRWLCTVNGPVAELDEIDAELREQARSICRYVVGAREVTPSGSRHLHILLWCDSRMTPNAIISALPSLDGANFKKVGLSSFGSVVAYVKKQGDWWERGACPIPREDCVRSESRADKMKRLPEGLASGSMTVAEAMVVDPQLWMRMGDDIQRFASQLRAERKRDEFTQPVLHPWQIEVERRLLHQSDRHILFVVDTPGARGKTWFAAYLRDKYGALVLADTEPTSAGYVWQYERWVVFDIARSGIPYYSTMEAFKNGHVVSTKYRVVTKTQNNMRVAVFMNRMPTRAHLSADRFDIMDLDTMRFNVYGSPTRPLGPSNSDCGSVASATRRLGLDDVTPEETAAKRTRRSLDDLPARQSSVRRWLGEDRENRQ